MCARRLPDPWGAGYHHGTEHTRAALAWLLEAINPVCVPACLHQFLLAKSQE